MWSFFRRFLTRFDELEVDHGPGDLSDPVVIPDAHPSPAKPELIVQPDGWIIAAPGSPIKVERIPTKRIQKLATPRGEPHAIVWHWTATPANSVRNAAKRIQALPEDDQRSSSFHLGIPRSGDLIVLASLETGTWHAGGPTAKRFVWVDGDHYDIARTASNLSANGIGIGIELENVGEVRLINGKWRSWPFMTTTEDENGLIVKTPAGHVVKETEILQHTNGKWYQGFTENQIHQATEVTRAAAIAYPNSITRKSAAWTHAMIDPGRKTDPGPIWTDVYLPIILEEVFG
jgi:N-acetyl-anhydromuramyl-L-alanine amidase AmpD